VFLLSCVEREEKKRGNPARKRRRKKGISLFVWQFIFSERRRAVPRREKRGNNEFDGDRLGEKGDKKGALDRTIHGKKEGTVTW